MATAIKAVRKQDKDAVVLDTGKIFPVTGKYIDRRGELALKEMAQMGYEAIAVGPSDIGKGFPVLQKMLAKKPNLPLVISNLVDSTGEKCPIGKRYIVLKREGKRIAILAVAPKEELAREIHTLGMDKRGVKAVAPDSAIKMIMGSIRNKVDMVVLVSHLSRQKTFSLLERIKGIDLAFLEMPERVIGATVPVNLKTKIVWVAPKGNVMKQVKASLLENGQVNIHTTSIRLDSSIPEDQRTASLIKNEAGRWEAADRKRFQEWRKKILSMTPEEYIQYLAKHGNTPPRPPVEPTIPKTSSGCK